jgi:LysM repeat protein
MHDLEHDPAHGQQLGDDSGFWDDVPDSRVARWRAARTPRHTEAQRDAVARGAGARHHHDELSPSSIDPTGSIPVVSSVVNSGVTSAVTATGELVRQASGHVDPLLRRAGAVAIVIAALVPVALSLRSSHPSASALAPSASSVAESPAPTIAAATTVALAPTSVVAPRSTSVGTAAAPRVSKPAHATRTATKQAATTVPRASTSVAAPTSVSPRVTVATRTATVVPRPVPRACTSSYRVVFGDAWIVIANKVHVPLSKLLAANHATASTPIYPGRTLCLPAGARWSKPASTSHAISHTISPTTSHAISHPTYVPSRSYTRAQVIQIIRDVWPDALEDHAIFIATRESNLVPTARNFCCQGLFQIYYAVHAKWLAQIGITSADQLLDPRTNARAAYAMYQRSGGFGPWGG